jgi:type 1 glutamine amidotransferase/HEAT repeat protein
MKHVLRLFCCVVALTAAILNAQDTRPQPSAAEIARMHDAMPKQLYTKPTQPRKVLIYCEAATFYHTSIPFANQALSILGEHSGAFTVASISTDPEVFEPENLKQFDVIVLNNNTSRVPLGKVNPDALPAGPQRQAAQEREERLRNGLLGFVRNGKGVLAIHAAIDAFYQWPEYGEMLGGYFDLHPWSESVAAELVDPGHPLMRAYKGRNFRINEEIYQVKAPYSRDKQRILMRLDTANTNMNKGEQIRRQDGDFALAWLKPYGEGRVFYLSFGHRHETFWDPATLQVLLDAMQYCAGDLRCDERPSNELDEAYLQQSAAIGRRRGLDDIFAELVHYRSESSERPLRQLEALVNEAMDPTQREQAQDLAARLAALLTDKTSAELRCVALRQLSRIGGEAEIAAIAKQIDSRHGSCSTMALYALQRIPGGAADQALMAAIAQFPTQGQAIAAVLGHRRAVAAVPALGKLLAEPDATAAAAAALGQIGGAAAAKLLLAALASNDAQQPLPILSGLIELSDSVNNDLQSRIAQSVLDHPAATPSLRGNALIALSRARGDDTLPLILEALHADELRLQRAAAEALVSRPEALASAIDQLNSLPSSAAALLLNACARARAKTLEEAIIQATAHADEEVSKAAIDALAVCGSNKAVRPLAELASGGGDKQRRARNALAQLDATGVDAAIRNLASDTSLPERIRAELFAAMGSRIDRESMTLLLQSASGNQATIRKEAIAALAAVANADDSAALIELLAKLYSATDRGRVENILVAVNRPASDPASAAAAATLLAGALRANPPPPTRISYLNVLGKLVQAESLPLIIQDCQSEDAGVKRAAILALSDWPDAAPLATLQALSRDQQGSLAHRVLALRGYARMLAMPSTRPMRDTLAMYREAFALVHSSQEKLSLLKGLGDIIHPDAMDLALNYRADPDLSNEAVIAATKIMNGLSGASIKLKASHGSNSLKNALDPDPKTRWTSGSHQRGNEWFEIDLGYETHIETIFLDAGDTGQDYPTAYRVFVSRFPAGDWQEPVASGQGDAKQLSIKPNNAYGRYIRIEQCGERNYFWSITRLQVNGVPEFDGGSALERSHWKLSANRSSAALANAIDGDASTRWDSGTAQRPGFWFAIDLGAERQLSSIILDSASSRNDFPRGYRVDVSLDGKTWEGPVGMGHGDSAITTIPLLPNKARMLKITLTDSVDPYYWSIHDLTIMGK